MRDEWPCRTERRFVGRFFMAAVGCLGLAAVGAVWAALAPVHVAGASAAVTRAKPLCPLPAVGQDLRPLLMKMAGRRLIRPGQVKAAVKDSGAAERLLKKLKLQGVVQTGADLVAYIRVDKEGTKSVREGQKVLDFVVARIEPGKVTLTLQGVEVVLGH